jgi:hypothetical protein
MLSLFENSESNIYLAHTGSSFDATVVGEGVWLSAIRLPDAVKPTAI